MFKSPLITDELTQSRAILATFRLLNGGDTAFEINSIERLARAMRFDERDLIKGIVSRGFGFLKRGKIRNRPSGYRQKCLLRSAL